MCLTPIKVKSVHYGEKVLQYIPCGTCDECRRREKSGWSFRLALELQKKLDEGWEIGFCTLTYNDEHLPHIPFECFADGNQYCEIPCFDKNQMRRFIRNLRSRLDWDYDVQGCVYFLGSEFGERRGRPHYHLLVCYPKDKIDYKQMHALIVDLWHENGYIFPEKPDGEREYEDGLENGFRVDSSKGAYLCAKYVCKYVCKDVGFEKFKSDVEFVTRANQGVKIPKVDIFGKLVYKDDELVYETAYQVYLRCNCFHLQSRSLGWSYFEGMQEGEKIDAFKQGVKFLGEEHRQKLPVYIKNKLIFDNKYVYQEEKDGTVKRLVEREANDFLKKNRRKLFAIRVDGYTTFFQKMSTLEYWQDRKAPDYVGKLALGVYDYLADTYGMNCADIAAYYLAYYNVPPRYCFCENGGYCSHDIMSLSWLRRYSFDVDENHEVLDLEFKKDFDSCVSTIFDCMSFLSPDDNEMTKKVDLLKKHKKERKPCLD